MIEQQKLVAEGAGAVSVAAAMFNKIPVEGKKVVCVVSGGNIDVNFLNRVITRGLTKSGRNCSFTIKLYDKPGQLSAVCSIIARLGGNIISVNHERTNAGTHITGCTIRVTLETRNVDHIATILAGLTDAGYEVID